MKRTAYFCFSCLDNDALSNFVLFKVSGESIAKKRLHSNRTIRASSTRKLPSGYFLRFDGVDRYHEMTSV